MRVCPGSPLFLYGTHREWGSFRLIVFDEHDEFEGPLGLCTAHTIGGPNRFSHRTQTVMAPPPNFMPGSAVMDQPIGTVVRSSPHAETTADVVDAAVFLPGNDIELDCLVTIENAELSLSGTRIVSLDDEPFEVYKVGARTGERRGVLLPEPALPSLRDEHGQSRQYAPGYRIQGQGRPFAEPGDSGAAVFDEEGRIVGLLVGMLGDYDRLDYVFGRVEADAFVMPIKRVLDSLGVRLPAS